MNDLTNDRPWCVVSEENLVGIDRSPGTMAPIPGSRMFEIKDALAVFRREHPNAEVFDASQGDGGASLPGVSREVLEAAAVLQADHGTGYDKPFGTEMFRTAVVEDYWGLDSGSGWGPANVLACQGGRDALLKAYDAAQFLGHGRHGDFVVTSRVPWISYNWGPYSVGANVMLAPGDEADGWAMTGEGIRRCTDEAARCGGRRVAMVVITSPDNPTGRSLSEDEQLELAVACLEAGVPFVLFDWIYHRVTDGERHDVNRFLRRLGPEHRDRCIFLDGITKSLGASNIRNAHLLAAAPVIKFMQSRASHGVIPSFHSQAVAVAAYRIGFDRASAGIVEPTNRSRAILAEALDGAGIRHILGKGYYAFVDVGPWIDRGGFVDSGELGAALGEQHGLATVPGVYFSRFGSRWLRFSYALPPETAAAAARRLIDSLGGM